jgi:hypothetical protein
MSDINGTIVQLLRDCVHDRRLSVGLFYRGNLSLAQRVISEGHRTLLLGDRFPKLYLANSRIDPASRRTSMIIETRFESLPIAHRSLDLLIMSSGMPTGDSPVVTLMRLRGYLRPGGTLIWPHPISDGFMGKLSRAVDPCRRKNLNAALRRQFCTWTMEAGFSEVGQTNASGALFPWVVTCGRAGNRPWERAGPAPRDSVYLSFRSPNDTV